MWFQATSQANFVHPFKFSPDHLCPYCGQQQLTMQHLALTCPQTAKHRLCFFSFMYIQLIHRLWTQILLYQLHHNDHDEKEIYQQKLENLLQVMQDSNNYKIPLIKYRKTKNCTLMMALNTLQAFRTATKTWKHNSMQITKMLSYIVPKNFLPITTSFLNNFCFPTFLQTRSKISLEFDLVKWLDLSQPNKLSHFQTFIDFGHTLPSFFSFKFPNFGSPHGVLSPF